MVRRVMLFQSRSDPLWLGNSADEVWPFVRYMGIVRGLTDGLDDACREQVMAELHRRIDANEPPRTCCTDPPPWLITAHQR